MSDDRPRSRIIDFARRHRGPLIIGGIVLLLGIGVLIYWLLSRGKEVTDDAQINGHMVMVTARVASHVRYVAVDDTDRVNAGQLLVQLDRRDLLQALRKAEADLAAQKAQTAAASGQIFVTQHTAPASAGEAMAATAIADQGVITAQTQAASAEAQVTAAEAAVKSAREQAKSAETDVEAATAQLQSARENVNVAEADVTAAQSDADTQQREAERYFYLQKEGAVSREQYENVKNISTTAQASLRSARGRLSVSQAAVARATANQAGSQALLARANSQVVASTAALKQAQVGVTAAQAGLRQAHSRLQQAKSAEFGTQTVPQQIGISESQTKAAAAKIAQSEAAVRQAQLNLSYAYVKAPLRGEVVGRNVNPGQYVQPGQALMAVVPLNDVWVDANFKETQLRHMKTGQRADLEVDTYSGRVFRGKVVGIGAASGERLSLLPPQNATGNFVKVVQRIPVRIAFDQQIPKGVVFRPGQNVIVTVYVR